MEQETFRSYNWATAPILGLLVGMIGAILFL